MQNREIIQPHCFFFKENEIQLLQKQMKNIKDGNLSEESEVLAKLLTENSKLKIRLETLNRVCT